MNLQFTKSSPAKSDTFNGARVPEKIDVGGTEVSKTSYGEVVELCCQWAHNRDATRSRYICVTSVHGIVTSRSDSELAIALGQADVVTPDGMPVVWAMRSFKVRGQQRVYGPTLMLQLCEIAAAQGLRIFLYGARDKTLNELSKRLCDRFPGLQIAGSYAPPFRPLTAEEDFGVQLRVESAKADILFVGLSTPKQEKWMCAHQYSIPGLTMIGVGAAFDIHAGRVRQAPLWMQQSGLEWLFRLLVEPLRLWRRYILITPKFLPVWLWQWWRFRRAVGSK